MSFISSVVQYSTNKWKSKTKVNDIFSNVFSIEKNLNLFAVSAYMYIYRYFTAIAYSLSKFVYTAIAECLNCFFDNHIKAAKSCVSNAETEGKNGPF